MVIEGGGGAGKGWGRDRGLETVCARGRIIRGLACLSLSYTVVGTWKVSSASAILCRTRHGRFYPAGREMSPLFRLFVERQGSLARAEIKRIAASFDRTMNIGH